MARKVIALLGQPIVTEDGVAAVGTIKPGHLVDGVTSIVKHSTASVNTPRNFALEQDYFGLDIDDAYNVADVVRVGQFKQGDHVYAFIPSGANIAESGKLESNGDGTLKAFGSGVVLARALEAVNNAAGPGEARLRVEIV